MKVYTVVEHNDWPDEGYSTVRLHGVFTTKELALNCIQLEHDRIDLTTSGLLSWTVYEVEVDLPNKYPQEFNVFVDDNDASKLTYAKPKPREDRFRGASHTLSPRWDR